jgi:hypothetical protein
MCVKPKVRRGMGGGSFNHTCSPAEAGARVCTCKAIEALTCLAFSSFGNIAADPTFHFSKNLC